MERKESSIISLREYFGKGKPFVIPSYQRGYKWAVRYDKKTTGVENLIQNLFYAIKTDSKQQYFLQGVTVAEENERIILIDGQQRTTTLYLLLWCLKPSSINNISLLYQIREKSGLFIEGLKKPNFNRLEFDAKGEYQDIHYFNEAINQINTEIEEESKKTGRDIDDVKSALHSFLIDKVNLLYIVIDSDKAVQTFSMMNGHKATMHQEELIKAEMLHSVSLPETIQEKKITKEDNFNELQNLFAVDWETASLRSKYAREWDKWLYWWNRKGVKTFFNIKNPMGFLLEFYFYVHCPDDEFSFRSFKKLLDGKRRTKLSFKGLRDLQKSFEDIYHSPILYNYLGLSLVDSKSKADIFSIIKYFIENKENHALLREYSLWRIVGATHQSIVSPESLTENSKTKEEYAQQVFQRLCGRYVYEKEDGSAGDGKYDAYKQLLRMNVLEMGDNLKFNFAHFKSKSLEHICPQHPDLNNKDFQKVQDEINEKSDGIHSIGNLLLLNGSVNSGMSNGNLLEKKVYLFNKIRDGFFLPHTLRVFSKAYSSNDLEVSSLFDEGKYWTADDVNNNKVYFFKQFELVYGISSQTINSESDE